MNKEYKIMKTVFKYPIPRAKPKFSLMLPRGFSPLRVDFQGDSLFLWACVMKDSLQVQVDFEVFGTGQDIPMKACYVATYFDGPFVFHMFQMN